MFYLLQFLTVFTLRRSRKTTISKVTAKILLTSLDSLTPFPINVEYLSDRKALTAFFLSIVVSHAPNWYYLHFRSENGEVLSPSFSATTNSYKSMEILAT